MGVVLTDVYFVVGSNTAMCRILGWTGLRRLTRDWALGPGRLCIWIILILSLCRRQTCLLIKIRP